jgi:hypothetical protein
MNLLRRRFKLTPELLRLNYEMNAATEPFCGWNLPDSHDITWKVTRDRRVAGYHKEFSDGSQPEIGISARCCGNLVTLTRIMQHEMVHLYQTLTKPKSTTPGVEHNAAFRRESDTICAIHGWDRMEFADAD